MSKSVNDKRVISLSLGRDTNGNKTLKVAIADKAGFAIQTNSNLPKTHRMTSDDLNYRVAIGELKKWVRLFGTVHQRNVTGFGCAF